MIKYSKIHNYIMFLYSWQSKIFLMNYFMTFKDISVNDNLVRLQNDEIPHRVVKRAANKTECYSLCNFIHGLRL